ncbi:MAG: transcriptional regulator PpsR [Gammaproteobacteria bacterium]
MASFLVAASGDLSLVVDREGVVADVAYGDERDPIREADDWVGKAWLETVTPESRPKVHDLLTVTAESAPSSWRQVNHPDGEAQDIPVLYRAITRDDEGNLIVVGRDLRAMSDLQQQLLDVQHSMERDYERLHQAETRYRMLFTLASEGILIVRADNMRVVEANPAAGRVFEMPVNKLIGRTFPWGFDDSGKEDVERLLAQVRAAGNADAIVIRSKGTERSIRVAATLLRREEGLFFLVRITTDQIQPTWGASKALTEIIQRSPDAFVVTDPQGRILAANSTFLEMCNLGTELQAQDQPLDRWVGRAGVDIDLLRKNLKQRGQVNRFSTTLRPEFGDPVDVELSAVAALDAEQPSMGFVIRRSLRPTVDVAPKPDEPLAQSLRDMTELIGRVPLKELVRETSDIIERLCIEAALRTTNDNRASAAELLGLSRQSLYVKLRRYGFGEAGERKKEKSKD